MCGDSTKTQDLDKLMDGKKADMVWTDPPYNINYEGSGLGKRKGILNDNMILRLEGKVTGEVIRKKLHTDLWYYDKPTKSDAHPTMKLIKLVLRAIRNSSKIDDIVLDTFGGSGSTLMACEQADRSCYTMELDPKYCDVIRKRYAQEIDKEAEWQSLSPQVK